MATITLAELKRELINEIGSSQARYEKDHFYDDFENRLREMDLSGLVFPDYTEEEMISVSGRQWKQRFKMLIPLVEHFQYLTSNERVTALALNQNGWLAKTYGGPRNACNVLKYATQIGLIAPAVQKKRFGCKDSYGYVYGWNKVAQKRVKKVIADASLLWNGKDNDNDISLLETFGKDYKDVGMTKLEFDRLVAQVRIGTDLKINATDEQIKVALLAKYPLMKRLVEEVAVFNQFFPEDEKIKAEPTIHRSEKLKLVTKIGFRLTNPYVSLKEHDNGRAYNGRWRKEFMDEKFGVGNWRCFDVKSSVPRVTYFLNHGVWLDNDVDVYALMFNEGKPFENPIDRDNAKRAFMRFYFDNSPSRISNRLMRNHLADKFAEKYGYSAGVCATVEEIKDDVFKVIGKSYGSEIFLYESYLYFKVLTRIMDEGVLPKQVYDAFYFPTGYGIEDRVQSLLREEAQAMIMDISLLQNFTKDRKHTMPHNENEPVFINQDKPRSKRRRTAKVKTPDFDIPDDDPIFQPTKIGENNDRNRNQREGKPDRCDTSEGASALPKVKETVLQSESSIRCSGTDELASLERREEAMRRFQSNREVLRDFILGRITREEAEAKAFSTNEMASA